MKDTERTPQHCRGEESRRRRRESREGEGIVQCVPKEAAAVAKGSGRRSWDRRVFGAAADPRHRCARPPSLTGDRDATKEQKMQGAGVLGKRIDEAKLVVRCPFRPASCRPNHSLHTATRLESSSTPPVLECSPRTPQSLHTSLWTLASTLLPRVVGGCLVLRRPLLAQPCRRWPRATSSSRVPTVLRLR